MGMNIIFFHFDRFSMLSIIDKNKIIDYKILIFMSFLATAADRVKKHLF